MHCRLVAVECVEKCSPLHHLDPRDQARWCSSPRRWWWPSPSSRWCSSSPPPRCATSTPTSPHCPRPCGGCWRRTATGWTPSAAPTVGASSDLCCCRLKRWFTRRLVITEKAPTRAFSWLKAPTNAFTWASTRHYAANQPAHLFMTLAMG